MKRVVVITIFLSVSIWANDCTSGLAQNLTAPVCTDARYFLLVGAGVTYASYMSNSTHQEKLRFDIARKRPLGDYGKIGEIIGWGGLNAAYIGYQYFKGKYWGDIEASRNSELAVEVFAYTSLMTLFLKTIINSPRPDGSTNDSFPSGHSSASFAWATVVMARHEWYYGLGAYALSSFIAFSRINDERHHWHDVYAGMTLGISYALGIYFNHTRHNKDFWIGALPAEGLDGMSLNVSYLF